MDAEGKILQKLNKVALNSIEDNIKRFSDIDLQPFTTHANTLQKTWFTLALCIGLYIGKKKNLPCFVIRCHTE